MINIHNIPLAANKTDFNGTFVVLNSTNEGSCSIHSGGTFCIQYCVGNPTESTDTVSSSPEGLAEVGLYFNGNNLKILGAALGSNGPTPSGSMLVTNQPITILTTYTNDNPHVGPDIQNVMFWDSVGNAFAGVNIGNTNGFNISNDGFYGFTDTGGNAAATADPQAGAAIETTAGQPNCGIVSGEICSPWVQFGKVENNHINAKVGFTSKFKVSSVTFDSNTVQCPSLSTHNPTQGMVGLDIGGLWYLNTGVTQTGGENRVLNQQTQGCLVGTLLGAQNSDRVEEKSENDNSNTCDGNATLCPIGLALVNTDDSTLYHQSKFVATGLYVDTNSPNNSIYEIRTSQNSGQSSGQSTGNSLLGLCAGGPITNWSVANGGHGYANTNTGHVNLTNGAGTGVPATYTVQASTGGVVSSVTFGTGPPTPGWGYTVTPSGSPQGTAVLTGSGDGTLTINITNTCSSTNAGGAATIPTYNFTNALNVVDGAVSSGTALFGMPSGGPFIPNSGSTLATDSEPSGLNVTAPSGTVSLTATGPSGSTADLFDVTTSGGSAGNALNVSSSGITTLGHALAVGSGGTGNTTNTAHGVLLGEGTNPVSATAAGTSAQLLLGQGTSADPTWNSMSGDATIGGSGSVTVSKINGTTFSGTNGDLVSFGASNTPADSGVVSGNVVTTGSGHQLFVTNARTSTYTATTSDFQTCKTIPVASGTFTITLVASGSQPASGQCVNIINYGSGIVTVAPSGQNINGGGSNLTIAPGSQSAPSGMHIVSDSSNYIAQPWSGGAILTSYSLGANAGAQTFFSTSSNNTINVATVTITASVTFSNLAIQVQTNDTTGTDTYAWGLYTNGSTATAVCTVNPVSLTTTGLKNGACSQTPPITIAPGTYVFATWNNTGNVAKFGITGDSVANATSLLSSTTAGTNSGGLPSTLSLTSGVINSPLASPVLTLN